MVSARVQPAVELTRATHPLLAADNIVRRYGARTILDGASVSVQSGEVLAIVGPNGAGKSTLFRTLLLLERPDAGAVRLGGAIMRYRDRRARGRIAGVFQRPLLFSGTVMDNVVFGLRATGVSARERLDRATAALRWLDLDELGARQSITLSGGEAQRVALARALVLRPEVLLLDEPTASLDVGARRQFRLDLERVARHRAGGVILITHDANEAFGLADRIAVMHDGRVVQVATPDEVMLRPATPFIAELTGAELLLHGRVDRIDDGLVAVRISPDAVLWSAAARDAAPAAGMPCVVAYRPEDVILAAGGAVQEMSAVNRLPATVQTVVPAGALMRVRIRTADDIILTALLTRRSVDSMDLSPGTAVTAHIKAAALHAWERDAGPGPRREETDIREQS